MAKLCPSCGKWDGIHKPDCPYAPRAAKPKLAVVVIECDDEEHANFIAGEVRHCCHSVDPSRITIGEA